MRDEFGETGEAGGVHVADGYGVEISGAEFGYVEAGVIGEEAGWQGWVGCLLEEDGDAMLADAEEKLSGGLVAEIGEIGAVEGGVWGEVCR